MTHTKTQTHLPKSDPPLRETRVAGARLTFTDEGASHGTAFFAIHGVPGSVRDFRYLAPPLISFARLIRVERSFEAWRSGPKPFSAWPTISALRGLG